MTSIATPQTLDDEFESIAREAPGFGGWYLDAGGEVVVVATQRFDHSALPAALRTSIAGRGISDDKLPKATIKPAAFDFVQLRQWYRALQPAIARDPDVVSVDIDEVTNTLSIGSTSTGATSKGLGAAMAALRIPASAVRVSAEEAARIATDITQNIGAPPPGGVIIRWFNAGLSQECTMGANVTYNGVAGFLTNSHCTINWGGVATVSQFRQGIESDPLIGLEHTDPFYQTCSSIPPRVCRWSDAAFVQYTNGASGDFGKIVRTDFFGYYPPDGNNGSKTISTSIPRFSITGTTGSPVVGTYIDRVGISTGWVTGPVNQTCVDRDQNQGSGKKLWCQSRANGPSAQGDSGGPIFVRVFCQGEAPPSAKNCAQFAGLYWGLTAGQMYFSPAGNLLIDFPGTFTFF